MRTKTTLLAIFVIVTAIALVTAGSITASTLAPQRKAQVVKKQKALKPVRAAVQQQQQQQQQVQAIVH